VAPIAFIGWINSILDTKHKVLERAVFVVLCL